MYMFICIAGLQLALGNLHQLAWLRTLGLAGLGPLAARYQII